MAKKTLADLKDLRGKRVLIRVDFNVPQDDKGHITNDRRIRAALPTLRTMLDQGASAIVMSHLGRPKGDPKKDAPFRMDRAAKRLGELLGRPVHKVDAVTGPAVTEAVRKLKPGEVLVLENLRFHPGEQAGDPAFAREIAALGDVYVNDAFGTAHRAHASTAGVAAYLPSAAGLLLEQELRALGGILEQPKRPLVALIGGAKIFTPASTVDDSPTTFYFDRQVYQPANFHENYMGRVTLRNALAHSLNVGTVQLAQAVGYDQVIRMARRVGLNEAIRPTPAVALGAYETTPLEIETLSVFKKAWVRQTIYPSESGVTIYFRDVSERRNVGVGLPSA